MRVGFLTCARRLKNTMLLWTRRARRSPAVQMRDDELRHSFGINDPLVDRILLDMRMSLQGTWSELRLVLARLEALEKRMATLERRLPERPPSKPNWG